MVNTIASRLAVNYRYNVPCPSMSALLIGSGSIFALVVVLKTIAAELD